MATNAELADLIREAIADKVRGVGLLKRTADDGTVVQFETLEEARDECQRNGFDANIYRISDVFGDPDLLCGSWSANSGWISNAGTAPMEAAQETVSVG